MNKEEKEQAEYDSDDSHPLSPNIDHSQAFCTECTSWYDVTTQSDRHAH